MRLDGGANILALGRLVKGQAGSAWEVRAGGDVSVAAALRRGGQPLEFDEGVEER